MKTQKLLLAIASAGLSAGSVNAMETATSKLLSSVSDAQVDEAPIAAVVARLCDRVAVLEKLCGDMDKRLSRLEERISATQSKKVPKKAYSEMTAEEQDRWLSAECSKDNS